MWSRGAGRTHYGARSEARPSPRLEAQVPGSRLKLDALVRLCGRSPRPRRGAQCCGGDVMARRIVESVRSLSQRLGSPGGDPPAMSSRPFPSPLGVETTRFRVDVKPERDVVFVVPTGELDLATVAQLGGQIDELRAASFKRVVLDLCRLELMDFRGLRLL